MVTPTTSRCGAARRAAALAIRAISVEVRISMRSCIVLEFADGEASCNVKVNSDKGIRDVQSTPFAVRRDMGQQSADFERRRSARLEGLGPLDAVRTR